MIERIGWRAGMSRIDEDKGHKEGFVGGGRRVFDRELYKFPCREIYLLVRSNNIGDKGGLVLRVCCPKENQGTSVWAEREDMRGQPYRSTRDTRYCQLRPELSRSCVREQIRGWPSISSGRRPVKV